LALKEDGLSCPLKDGQHYYQTLTMPRMRAFGAFDGVQSGPITTIFGIYKNNSSPSKPESLKCEKENSHQLKKPIILSNFCCMLVTRK